MPILTMSLPSVTLPGIHVMDVTSLQTPTYAEVSRATILDENNWTTWSPATSQNIFSLNYSITGLLFAGTFAASAEPSAISISRSLAVNLTTYPITYMLIKVSLGVSYGIRFYSHSSGSVVQLWTETDALNHRPGKGQSENVQVNMIQMIELNTGKVLNTVDSVTVYVERGASAKATDFSLQVGRFEFLNYPLTLSPSVGSYHAIYVGLKQFQQNPSFTLRSIQFKGRLNASIEAVIIPYFIQGLAVYSGSVYTITTVPFDLSITITILAQAAKLFSDNLPVETVALVMVAASGTLTRTIVERISLNYFSQAAQTSAVASQGRDIYVDDAFFILLMPVSVILLIHGQLRRTRRAKCCR